MSRDKLTADAATVAPEQTSDVPRCPETKGNANCVKDKGHKGKHLANSQDFIITWSNK